MQPEPARAQACGRPCSYGMSPAGAGMAVSLETRPALELPVDVRPETPWRRRRRLRQTPLAILLLLPALLIIGTFHFFPLLYAFFISLRNWGIVDQGMVWFKNYN